MSINTSKTYNRFGGLLAGMSRELRCSICLSLLKEATTTFCGHTFCKKCIESQLNNKGICPTCNRILSSSQLNSAESLQGIVGQFMQMKDEFERANGVDLSTIDITNLSQENSSDVKDIAIETDSTPAYEYSTAENLIQYRILQLNHNRFEHIDIPGACFETKLNPDVTHVVLDTVNQNLVKNSPKYRMAILYGCYIVSDTWLKISIEQGQMNPEQRFEIYGDETYGRTGAPSRARLRREARKPNLFRKLKIDLVSDVKNEYRKYLTVGRAEIGESTDLLVCNLDCDIEDLRKKHPDKVLISCKWIDDSICRYELEDKSKYIL